MKTLIYKMYDPRFPKEIRYIGKTTKNLSTRLTEHLSKAKYRYGRTNHRLNWLSKLLDEDIIPTIEKLDETSWENSSALERKYITEYLEKGHDLVNSDDRGEGQKNKIISAETREKMSSIKKEQYKNNRVNIQYKKIYKYDLNGSLLNEYSSLNEASEKCNIHVSTIIRCAKGKYKTGKGFIWSYDKKDTLVAASKKRKSHTVNIYKVLDTITTEVNYLTIYDFEKFFNKPKNFICGYINKNNRVNRKYLITKTNNKKTIDLVKLREFRETPEVDNPEPSFAEM